MTMSGVTDTYHEDPLVLTATFPLLGGANLAVQKLQDLEKRGLLDVNNTITVSKNAWEKNGVNPAEGDKGPKAASNGPVVGGVMGLNFPPSLLATTALGAAIGGMTGVLCG